MKTWASRGSCVLVVSVVLTIVLAGIPALAQPAAKSPERLKAESLVDQGMKLSDHSQKEEDFYRQAISADSTYPKPYLDLGLVYYDRHNYPEALTWLKKYLEFEKDALDGVYQTAACHECLGETKEALDCYYRYLKIALDLPPDKRAKEEEFMKSTAQAIERLRPPAGPVIPASTSVAQHIQQCNKAAPKQIADILSRPRTRGIYRFDGPVYPNTEILFDKDSAKLRQDSVEPLKRVGEALKDQRLTNAKIKIGGHASTEGEEGHNVDLSKQRAATVRDFLSKECEIPPDRLEVEGFGAAVPLIKPEKSESDREYNRRVEFENVGPSAKPPKR